MQCNSWAILALRLFFPFHRCSVSPFLITCHSHTRRKPCWNYLNYSWQTTEKHERSWQSAAKRARASWSTHVSLGGMRCTQPASVSAQPAWIGAVCSRSLHFHCSLPSLFPTHLHLRSAPCGTLSPVAVLTTTFLSSWLNHHLLSFGKPLFSLSFPSPSVFTSADDPWGRACHFKWGVSLHWMCWAERWVSAFAAGAPEIVGHRWCRLHPSGAATGQRTESCLHVWMCFVLRADWREKTDGSNRGREACSKRRTSDRGLGEEGEGSAESASKVKGESPLTFKRKNWKKEGFFLLRLRDCRESGESGAPQTLWRSTQKPGADWDTEVVNHTGGGGEAGSWRTSSAQRWAYIRSGAEDKRRASLQEIHSVPSSQESAGRSHHGCPTHAGISRLFAHGESRGGYSISIVSLLLSFFLFLPSFFWLSPCHSPHRAGVEPSSH